VERSLERESSPRDQTIIVFWVQTLLWFDLLEIQLVSCDLRSSTEIRIWDASAWRQFMLGPRTWHLTVARECCLLEGSFSSDFDGSLHVPQFLVYQPGEVESLAPAFRSA
jgi:hypothetical protein